MQHRRRKIHLILCCTILHPIFSKILFLSRQGKTSAAVLVVEIWMIKVFIPEELILIS